jgi:hypothetical protein
MLKVSRAICWQVGALVIAIVFAIVLSRFLPIVSFIEASQHRVMSWGAWGAVCYPLLFAACNIRLRLAAGLPGDGFSKNFHITRRSAHWDLRLSARVGRLFS